VSLNILIWLHSYLGYCQALADHATTKLQSRVATFTSRFIY
jgi:hypothetical protein